MSLFLVSSDTLMVCSSHCILQTEVEKMLFSLTGVGQKALWDDAEVVSGLFDSRVWQKDKKI